MALVSIDKNRVIDLPASYDWHSKQNETQFAYEREAFILACENDLVHQVSHYVPRILDVFWRDHAERVHDLVLDRFQYDGWYYHAPLPFSGISVFENSTLRAPYGRTGERAWKGELRYVNIEHYTDMMPLDALRKLTYLKGTLAPQPEAYWIASPDSSSTRTRYDPWLCVSFRNWAVAVCEWV